MSGISKLLILSSDTKSVELSIETKENFGCFTHLPSKNGDNLIALSQYTRVLIYNTKNTITPNMIPFHE